MPWDEIKPRRFPAFDRELDEDLGGDLDWGHVNRQLAQAEAAREGAIRSDERERVPTA